MSALVIANTQIRRDDAGRYSLNDLHQASGSAVKNQPTNWLRLDKTVALIDELAGDTDLTHQMCRVKTEVGPGAMPPVVQIEGRYGGTYAVKELVYAYAMWISPRFHLHVIRAYDAMVTGETAQPPAVPAAPMHRADVLVSAARGFGALVKVGRIMGMQRQQAVEAANAATFRHTGIDMMQELDPQGDRVAKQQPILPSPTDSIVARLSAWLAGKQSTTMEAVIIEALHGDAKSKELQTRAGMAMRQLGWQSARMRLANGTRERIWRAPPVD